MAPDRKVVVVTGATGTQGSGVVQVCMCMCLRVLQQSPWRVSDGAGKLDCMAMPGPFGLFTFYAHWQALLLSKEFQVRALTRNASSEAAQALVQRGIEVVSADLAHKQSLLQVRKYMVLGA